MQLKKKRPAKKTPTVKGGRRAAHRQPEAAREILPSDKRYVVINDLDPDVEAKRRLVWLIVGFLGLGLVLFWFGSLRYTISQNRQTAEDGSLTQQVGSTLSDIGKILQEASEAIKDVSSQTASTTEVQKIKSDVLTQIQNNLNITAWPVRTSEAIGISLQYPIGWDIEENSYSLTIATTTKSLSAEIIITKKNNSKNITLADWLKNSSLWDKSGDTFIVAGQPALRYVKRGVTENKLDELVIIGYKKTVYEIELLADKGKTGSQPIMERALETIKILE